MKPNLKFTKLRFNIVACIFFKANNYIHIDFLYSVVFRERTLKKHIRLSKIILYILYICVYIYNGIYTYNYKLYLAVLNVLFRTTFCNPQNYLNLIYCYRNRT